MRYRRNTDVLQIVDFRLAKMLGEAETQPMRTRPDVLTRLDFDTGPVLVDEYGYLTNPDDWSDSYAARTAATEGITLTPEHYEIIDFMRSYHDDHGIAADVRFVLKYLSRRDGVNKSGAKDILFTLFPQGYVKQACKIAGMKQPRAWSTG